jgi:hypothetical protein
MVQISFLDNLRIYLFGEARFMVPSYHIPAIEAMEQWGWDVAFHSASRIHDGTLQQEWIVPI